MNVTVNLTAILVFLNIVATIFGLMRLGMSFERRMTKMETLLEVHDKYIASDRRRNDRPHEQETKS